MTGVVPLSVSHRAFGKILLPLACKTRAGSASCPVLQSPGRWQQPRSPLLWCRELCYQAHERALESCVNPGKCINPSRPGARPRPPRPAGLHGRAEG